MVKTVLAVVYGREKMYTHAGQKCTVMVAFVGPHAALVGSFMQSEAFGAAFYHADTGRGRGGICTHRPGHTLREDRNSCSNMVLVKGRDEGGGGSELRKSRHAHHQ